MKIFGRVGWPPFECKGQAGFTYYGQEVVEVDTVSTAVMRCEWRKPHCEDCRILREHSAANPDQACWCQHCAIAAIHQADLRKEKALEW